MSFKPTLVLDFDGVIHSYSSGWKGADVVSDPPVPGAIDFIVAALEHFKVAIYSSRSNERLGVAAMSDWLFRSAKAHFDGDASRARGLVNKIQWPTAKPAAFVTIDDRALTFTGSWPSIDELLAFKPWNKLPAAPAELAERLGRIEVAKAAPFLGAEPQAFDVRAILTVGLRSHTREDADALVPQILLRLADALRQEAQ